MKTKKGRLLYFAVSFTNLTNYTWVLYYFQKPSRSQVNIKCAFEGGTTVDYRYRAHMRKKIHNFYKYCLSPFLVTPVGGIRILYQKKLDDIVHLFLK